MKWKLWYALFTILLYFPMTCSFKTVSIIGSKFMREKYPFDQTNKSLSPIQTKDSPSEKYVDFNNSSKSDRSVMSSGKENIPDVPKNGSLDNNLSGLSKSCLI